MERELIETFLMISEFHTISETAEMMYTSQSTISHRLKTLEDYLGVRLFNRKKGIKKVTLTTDGERFYSLAQRWLDLDDSMRSFNQLTPYRKLNIGGLDSVNQYLLRPILPEIRKKNPELPLECFSFHSQEIYRRLVSRELDIGFAFFPVHFNELSAEPVFREPVVMISLKDSVYEEENITPVSLDKGNEVFFSWDSNLAQWHDEWWPRFRQPFAKVNSSALLINFMCSEKSWAMCPMSVAISLHEERGMKLHRFTDPPPDRTCYMLTRRVKHAEQEESIELFKNNFYALLADHPWRYPV